MVTGWLKRRTLRLDSYIADGEVYYRVLEGPNGWLDARAGGRYFNTFNRLGLTSNDSKINQAAAQLRSCRKPRPSRPSRAPHTRCARPK